MLLLWYEAATEQEESVRLSIICLASATAFVATTAEAATTRDIETSWGRPGVTYSEYRSEAASCENEAVATAIAGTPEVKQLIKASRALDNAYAMAWMANPPTSSWGANPTGIISNISNPWNAAIGAARSFGVEDSIQGVRGMLQATMDSCLWRHGYRQFRLTEEQRGNLKKLPLGSERRQKYLHRLASDATVLQVQAF
jgi:hypothetical protein